VPWVAAGPCCHSAADAHDIQPHSVRLLSDAAAHQLERDRLGVCGDKGPNGQAWERLVLLSRWVEDLAGCGDVVFEAKTAVTAAV
jgi:hypothetical protein